jgi:hypothetical protein
MIIKHIYTVVRKYEIDPEELEEETSFFKGAITDEPGEYLYSGPCCVGETITVEMKVENTK